jgi:hypothetical protein
MGWLITRAEVIEDPLAARLKVMERLRPLAKLEDPDRLVLPILVDAVLMAASYRGARHEVTFLNDLTRKVDLLLSRLNAHEQVQTRHPPFEL